MRYIIRKDTQVNEEENWDYILNEITPKESDVKNLFIDSANYMIDNIPESDVNNIEDNIPYDKFKNNMKKIGLYLIAVYLFGATNGKKKIPGKLGKTDFNINIQDNSTQNFIKNQVDKLIDEVTKESQKAIKEIVKRSKKKGLTPALELERIKNVIGLNTKQAIAADNYYLYLLDNGVKPERALKMAKDYSKRMLDARGKTIAQTELMRALNRGHLDLINGAIKAGVIKESDYMKEWWTSRDERVCKYCGPLHGVRVKPSETFDSGLGNIDGPPLHVNCRCDLIFVPTKKGENK